MAPCVFCLRNKVKEEASPSLSDAVHVDPSGLVTLTTPSRQHTLSVRAFPLPLGKDSTHSNCISIQAADTHSRQDTLTLTQAPKCTSSHSLLFDPLSHTFFVPRRGDSSAGEKRGADSDSRAAKLVSERGQERGRQSESAGGHQRTPSPAGESAAGEEVEEHRGSDLVLRAPKVSIT